MANGNQLGDLRQEHQVLNYRRSGYNCYADNEIGSVRELGCNGSFGPFCKSRREPYPLELAEIDPPQRAAYDQLEKDLQEQRTGTGIAAVAASGRLDNLPPARRAVLPSLARRHGTRSSILTTMSTSMKTARSALVSRSTACAPPSRGPMASIGIRLQQSPTCSIANCGVFGPAATILSMSPARPDRRCVYLSSPE